MKNSSWACLVFISGDSGFTLFYPTEDAFPRSLESSWFLYGAIGGLPYPGESLLGYLPNLTPALERKSQCQLEMVFLLILFAAVISLQGRGLLQTKRTAFPHPWDTNLTEKPSILLNILTTQSVCGEFEAPWKWFMVWFWNHSAGEKKSCLHNLKKKSLSEVTCGQGHCCSAFLLTFSLGTYWVSQL